MNDIFESLNCDEDVLKFGEDTFTVGKFKTLVAQDLHSRFNESTNNNRVDMKSFFAYIRLKTSQVSIALRAYVRTIPKGSIHAFSDGLKFV